MIKNNPPQLLNCRISGRGPVAVLLHGYLSALNYWDDLVNVFEANYTVVAIDLLGFGRSPKPKLASYDYDDHLASISLTLRHYGLGEPELLIGHSMGALLALRYARMHQESTGRLLLLNMPLFFDAQEARKELAGTSFLYRVGLYWGLHRLIWPLMRTSLAKITIGRLVPSTFAGTEGEAFLPTAEARSRSLRNVIESQSSITDLKGLQMPTTLVIGTKDRSVYRKNLRYLAAKTGLKVLLVDTGHHTLLEDFSFTAELI